MERGFRKKIEPDRSCRRPRRNSKFGETEMTRALSLVVAILLVGPAVAKAAEPTPKDADAVAPEAQKAPAILQAPVPKVAEPRKRKLDRDLQQKDLGTLPPSIPEKGKSRVPTSGHIAPISDAVRRVTRPPGVPSEIRGLEGVQRALSYQLRLDGRAGRVDLREQNRPGSRVDWQLDTPESDFALLSLRRDASGRCPAAGTSRAAAERQQSTDPSVLFYQWGRHRESYEQRFYGETFSGLSDVYVQVCGVRDDSLNGVASNVVHVQLRSTPWVLQIPVARWSVEWSSDMESNFACSVFGSRDTSLPSPPTGVQLGFKSLVERGPDPTPCIRDTLYVYQPSARFDLTGLPRDARIVRAELRFIEADPERRSESGRLCTSATRSVGMATTPVGTGNRAVEAVSGRADDARSVSVESGSERSVEVADWVRAWLGGRAADVTFLGPPPRREGAACLARLLDAEISVEYH